MQMRYWLKKEAGKKLTISCDTRMPQQLPADEKARPRAPEAPQQSRLVAEASSPGLSESSRSRRTTQLPNQHIRTSAQ